MVGPSVGSSVYLSGVLSGVLTEVLSGAQPPPAEFPADFYLVTVRGARYWTAVFCGPIRASMGLTLFLRSGWRSELTLRPQEAEVTCVTPPLLLNVSQHEALNLVDSQEMTSSHVFFIGVCAGMCVCVIGGAGQTGVFT